MGENDILVVKCNAVLSRTTMDWLRDYILGQRESGLILLPNICEAVVVPKDIEIRVE